MCYDHALHAPCDCRWQVETMAVDGVEYPRVCGDAVPLPNGKFAVLNGMKVGGQRWHMWVVW